MGGTSSSQQQQQSVSQPWAPAQPALQGVLGQVNTGLGNTGVTAAESQGLDTGVQNSYNWSNLFGPQFASIAQGLANGGGAQANDPMLKTAYQNYFNQTNPLASNTNYNPYDTPGFRDAINTATSDITNGVNGSFAAAGRDFSGMNSQTLGRGLTQGLAPTIAAQYNQNVQNQQGAAGNLFNAGNTTAGLLNGTNAAANANRLQAMPAATSALNAQNTGANAELIAEAQRRNIPVQALGLLAQIGIPIAGLGGQTNSTGSGTNTMSGAQQFGTIAQGIGGLFPKAPTTFNF